MLGRVWRKGIPLTLLVGVQTSTVIMEKVWRFLKNLEIELPYDPAIPLLGVHTKKMRIEKDTCTPGFIAALFTIARAWKQPRCPLVDEWIRKLWYIYTMEYYSAIKKEHIWVSSNEVDETGAHYTEWSKPEQHQYRILMHIVGTYKDGNDYPICKIAKETQM